MDKRAPRLSGILAMVFFAFSCFGLLLYLWVSFGGAIPLQPKEWRFTVGFEQAAQLNEQADVRVAGVGIGKVIALEREPSADRTRATIEIDSRYAPLPADTRALLRTKSLLGETYVELAFGSRGGRMLREGEQLANARVERHVQLDEILDSLDPYTREAFKTWQRELGRGVGERGSDINDSLAHFPAFVTEAGDLTAVLDRQEAAVRGFVRNSSVVFGALAKHRDQLRDLIADSDTIFDAIAAQRDAWAQTWGIMPTFLEQSRLTFRRLDRFAADTDPLLADLTPAVEDLGPTLRSVGTLAPDLRRFFDRLDPLITLSRRSLPATREIVDGLRPVLRSLGPWLAELNPILLWIGEHSTTLSDFLTHVGFAAAPTTPSNNAAGVGHYLRQLGPSGVESVAMHARRVSTNRGNAYLNPGALLSEEFALQSVLPSWDCRHIGGPKEPDSTPACSEQEPYPWQGRDDAFPKVLAGDYAKP